MTEDIIARIDQALDCVQCHKPLGDSPSPHFCSEPCESLWRAKLTKPLPLPPDDRAALLDPPPRPEAADESASAPAPNAPDPQVGWLAQWFRRHR